MSGQAHTGMRRRPGLLADVLTMSFARQCGRYVRQMTRADQMHGGDHERRSEDPGLARGGGPGHLAGGAEPPAGPGEGAHQGGRRDRGGPAAAAHGRGGRHNPADGGARASAAARGVRRTPSADRLLLHAWHAGKPAEAQCEGCTFFNGQIRELSYLHSRDVTYATFCQGPYAESAAYRDFMGWDMPWYSARDGADELLAGRWFGMQVCYLRDGDRVFETYWSRRAAPSRSARSQLRAARHDDLRPAGDLGRLPVRLAAATVRTTPASSSAPTALSPPRSGRRPSAAGHSDDRGGSYPRLTSGSTALVKPAATALSIVQPCPSARPRSKAAGSPRVRATASLPGRS